MICEAIIKNQKEISYIVGMLLFYLILFKFWICLDQLLREVNHFRLIFKTMYKCYLFQSILKIYKDFSIWIVSEYVARRYKSYERLIKVLAYELLRYLSKSNISLEKKPYWYDKIKIFSMGQFIQLNINL